MFQIDPRFQAWVDRRKVAQRTSIPIPTNNANPTPKAGKKNSNGTQSRKNVSKAGVPKDKKSKSVGRPKGKYRANNNF